MIIDTFSRYFLWNEKAEDYNVMINGKNFFDQPIKIDVKTCMVAEMGHTQNTFNV